MLSYQTFDTSPTEDWLKLLNSDLVRKHLLQHPQFNPETLRNWLQTKIKEDQKPGCRRYRRSEHSSVYYFNVSLSLPELLQTGAVPTVFWSERS